MDGVLSMLLQIGTGFADELVQSCYLLSLYYYYDGEHAGFLYVEACADPKRQSPLGDCHYSIPGSWSLRRGRESPYDQLVFHRPIQAEVCRGR